MPDFVVPLPPAFRRSEVLAFHGRDPLQLAERVDGGRLRKGLLLDGQAGVLTIELGEEVALCRFDGDGRGEGADVARLTGIVERMLGLHLEPRQFETRFCDDSLLGSLIARQPGLRIPQAATAFEALTWAITGQQINLAFAITLRRRLIERAGRRHSSGLWCYPQAEQLADLTPEELGELKFTRAKSETLVRVARQVAAGELDLEALAGCDPMTAERQLTAVKGIGPWTAHYTLLRGLGMADCSLHGDVAVRNALTTLTGSEGKLTVTDAERVLGRYAPFRSLAAAHLWASLSKSEA
ncbi:AlkA N-terminal domain-containing protein [Crenobacter sp. SG2303]|uniref:DNA-3-methyladenine glycosylase II n=1 Tax=Crenobacter oryzisoli TaxID=3056844 RepID=A0ABT7XKE6_9NEIS|nr:AlkA N-terminal domain-containing protein [Crenobacter sp. SG2303]MDN0074248.1 AlkA N-terminal domain-containing protein [Crenobacter sp. SG2303]